MCGHREAPAADGVGDGGRGVGRVRCAGLPFGGVSACVAGLVGDAGGGVGGDNAVAAAVGAVRGEGLRAVGAGGVYVAAAVNGGYATVSAAASGAFQKVALVDDADAVRADGARVIAARDGDRVSVGVCAFQCVYGGVCGCDGVRLPCGVVVVQDAAGGVLRVLCDGGLRGGECVVAVRVHAVGGADVRVCRVKRDFICGGDASHAEPPGSE